METSNALVNKRVLTADQRKQLFTLAEKIRERCGKGQAVDLEFKLMGNTIMVKQWRPFNPTEEENISEH